MSAADDRIVPDPDPADLTISSITDNPDPVALGGYVAYSITVTNLGPDPSSGALLTVSYPVGFTFVTVPGSSPECGPGAGVTSCFVGTLAAGASKTFTVGYWVGGSTGTVTTSASVAGGAPIDPNLTNNSASTTTTIVLGPPLEPPLIPIPDCTCPGSGGSGGGSTGGGGAGGGESGEDTPVESGETESSQRARCNSIAPVTLPEIFA